MNRIEPITREAHGALAWRPVNRYGFVAGDVMIPVCGAEMPRAALTFPVVFTRHAGRVSAVALLAPFQGRNLFVADDGQWLGAYIPAVLRGYPFMLLRSESGGDAVLGVDGRSGAVVPAGAADAQPFFDADGAPADGVRRIVAFLQQLEANRLATDAAVAALEAADLFRPWQARTEAPAGLKLVDGLLTVDEARLNALDDAAHLELRRAGALPLVYAHLLSLGQTVAFDRMAMLHRQLAQAATQRQQPTLGDVFTGPRPEDLKFSWDAL